MIFIQDVYWGNSLFSIADREYNQNCVNELRKNGVTVFLPQEAAHNHEKAPSEIEIFRNDTHAIFESKIFVACIDQETIDCGVACEIGVALMLKKYIIGLYTDLRKDRITYKMYKNPYVIGAILSSGEITSTIDELLRLIKKHL